MGGPARASTASYHQARWLTVVNGKFSMPVGSGYEATPPSGPVMSTVLVEVFYFSISKWKDVLMVKCCAHMTPPQ